MLDAPESPAGAEVRERLQALGDFLRRQRVKVDDRARPAIDTAEAFRVYVRLLRAATSARQTDAEFFGRYDLLLCPVAGVAAFPHDQQGERHERIVLVDGRRAPVTDHLFWAGYSGASLLPSTAGPCGFTPAGLPVGVQIVGPQYGDLTCLAFARLLDREY